MTLPTVELTDRPDAALVELLQSGLIEDNRPFLGEWDQRPLALSARAEGDVVGGLVGGTARGILFIEFFWLASRHRRHGLGSRLLAEAEAEALRRGCRMAWLDTFDFQARTFYERHGYSVFGELGGLPNGHRRHFMSKRLGRSAAET